MGWGMKYLFKPLWLTLLFTSFIVACTESADNPPGSKDGPNKGEVRPIGELTLKDGKFIVDGNLLDDNFFTPPGELTGFGSAEVAKLQDENLHKPIIYGVGGGGITINNTLKESETLLTPPDFGPISDGRTWYNEQVMVQWKLDGDPRRPRFIAFLNGYKGTLNAGSFGEIGMSTKWLSYKGGDPEAGAKRLIVELHRELEQVPDPTYNCLESTKYKRCTLDFENKDFFFMIFPGIQIAVAKAEFQIGFMLVPRNTEPGLLANRFDILSGSIMVPDQDAVKLGNTKKEIFDRLVAELGKTDPEVFIGTAGFGYLWEGIYLDFHRTNYVNTQKEAEDSNVSTFVQILSTFPDYATIEGKRILVTQKPGEVSFALEEKLDPLTHSLDAVQKSADEVEYKLKMTTPIWAENSIEFTDKFAAFIAEHLKKSYDVVEYRSFGYQNEEKVNKFISTSIRAYNKSDYNGISVGFSVNERQNRLGGIFVGLLDTEFTPFNAIINPASQEDVVRVEGPVEVIDGNGDPVLDHSTAKTLVDKTLCQWFEHPGFEDYILLKTADVNAYGADQIKGAPADAVKPLIVGEMAECKPVINVLTCKEKLDDDGQPVLDDDGQPVLDMESCDYEKDFSTSKAMMTTGLLPHYTQLAGMKLNDAVILTEVDALGRGEASVQYVYEDGTLTAPERSGFTEQGNFTLPEADEAFTKERQQSFVSVGAGTVLGLKMLPGVEPVTGGVAGRVVSISSNNVYAFIKDLCGLGDSIKLRIGMTEGEVENALVAAIDARKATDSKYQCNYFKKEDDGNLGYLSEIYFPDQRITLEFSNRAFGAATIYLPMTDVNEVLPKVAK